MINGTAFNDDGLDFGLVLSGGALNGAAVNRRAVNGDVTSDITLEGAFDVSLGMQGSLYHGVIFEGQTAIDLLASATMSAGIMSGASTAAIALTTAFAPSVRVVLDGTSPIVLPASMTGAAGRMGNGEMSMGLEATFDVIRRAMIEGDIEVAFLLDGGGRIIGKVFLTGDIQVGSLDTLMDGQRAVTHRPRMPMLAEFGITGAAWLELRGQGDIDIDVDIAGDVRTGERIALGGDLAIEVLTTASGRRYALVDISGTTDLRLDLVSMPAGRPAIPTDYVPAPAKRRFRVPRETRSQRVPQQDRRL